MAIFCFFIRKCLCFFYVCCLIRACIFSWSKEMSWFLQVRKHSCAVDHFLSCSLSQLGVIYEMLIYFLLVQDCFLEILPGMILLICGIFSNCTKNAWNSFMIWCSVLILFCWYFMDAKIVMCSENTRTILKKILDYESKKVTFNDG